MTPNAHTAERSPLRRMGPNWSIMALSLFKVNGTKKFMMMASNNRATPQVTFKV